MPGMAAVCDRAAQAAGAAVIEPQLSHGVLP